MAARWQGGKVDRIVADSRMLLARDDALLADILLDPFAVRRDNVWQQYHLFSRLTTDTKSKIIDSLASDTSENRFTSMPC